jgi:hypothetical protein
MVKSPSKKGPTMSRVDVKPQAATEVLIEKLAHVIDKKYDEMSDEDIQLSQQKLKALRDRVRASRAPKRETA